MPHFSFKLLLKIISFLYAMGLIILLPSIHTPTARLEKYLIQTPRVDRKDWNDYMAMQSDNLRSGPGEQGKSAQLSTGTDLSLVNIIVKKYGFNGLVSDMISLNRSLPDVRTAECKTRKYLADLPSVSIVMSFYNEYLSVLLRSLHSIVNRTPSELLQEIIIVDDASQFGNLGKELDQYVANHFEHKVKIERLPRRVGLIRARMAGFRKAFAKVLVALDSHIEVGYNWLPPLLEPIALNKRIVVSPLHDIISFQNFEYVSRNIGVRGGFSWDFTYRSLKIKPEDLRDKTKLRRNPVMHGGLFAISADFFWELGGYDEGLDISGGEEYELSFKIWMCGGQLLDVPCSRVGHLNRSPSFVMINPRGRDYHMKNTKRVAEVWMDEYKNFIHNQSSYNALDAGDLTARKVLREKLKCKSFKWYLEQVAQDVIKFYPPIEPPPFAYGSIQSVATPKLCIDSYSSENPRMYICARNATHPHPPQNFELDFLRRLRLRGSWQCFDSWGLMKNGSVALSPCHIYGGNQFWYYDRDTRLIIHRKNGRRCLEASPRDQKLYVNDCQKDNLNMKWNFGAVNDTAFDKYFENLDYYGL